MKNELINKIDGINIEYDLKEKLLSLLNGVVSEKVLTVEDNNNFVYLYNNDYVDTVFNVKVNKSNKTINAEFDHPFFRMRVTDKKVFLTRDVDNGKYFVIARAYGKEFVEEVKFYDNETLNYIAAVYEFDNDEELFDAIKDSTVDADYSVTISNLIFASTFDAANYLYFHIDEITNSVIKKLKIGK